MRKLLIILVAVVGNLSANPIYAAQTATATLTWDSNTESDIAKYTMHMGSATGAYSTTLDVIHIPGIPTQTSKFLDLPEGESFFAVTACDTAGNCSGSSNEVSKIVSIAPGIPGNLGVTVDINVTIRIP